jgi:hypothetical protein
VRTGKRRAHLDLADVACNLLAVAVRRVVEQELEHRVLVVEPPERAARDGLGERALRERAEEPARARLVGLVGLLGLGLCLDEVAPVRDAAPVVAHRCEERRVWGG